MADAVDKMEMRRAAREEERRLGRAKADADAKNAAAGSKAEQERAHKLALAKRSVRKEAVVVPRFESALQTMAKLQGSTDNGDVSHAEVWWASTMPKPMDASELSKVMWKEGDSTPREEFKNLIDKYKGKEVPAGYRGVWDEVPAPDRLEADITVKNEIFLRKMTVHIEKTEEQIRKEKKAYDQLSLAEQRVFDRAQKAAKGQSDDEERALQAAMDAEDQARLEMAEAASYDEVMNEYKEFENMKLGRSNECNGSESCRMRPSYLQNPADSFKWVEKLKATPRALKHHLPEVRAKTAMRFADMTEFLTEAEAVEMIELGVIEPLMDVWAEANDDTSRENVWGWLQATKAGTEKQMLRHTHILSISFCRIMRNLSHTVLKCFNLQPIKGKGLPGCITYDWLLHPATFLELLFTQPGVLDLLCRHLAHPNDECKEHACYALKNLSHHDKALKKMILDGEALVGDLVKPVLETLRLLLESSNLAVQAASAELLSSICYSDATRERMLRHRGAKGASMLPTVARLMTSCDESASQALGAQIIWDLCVKSHRNWKAAAAQGNKPKSVHAVKRAVAAGKLTIAEATEMMGDGNMVDFVKQDICREPGLIKALSHVLQHGAAAARISGAGAVWALCVERGNKRYLAQDHDLLKAIAHLIQDLDAPAQARTYAARALRNLATDQWVMDCLAAADKDLVKVLLRHCDILNWQHALVSPAISLG